MLDASRATSRKTEELVKCTRECRELQKFKQKAEHRIGKLENEVKLALSRRSSVESRPPRVASHEEGDHFLPNVEDELLPHVPSRGRGSFESCYEPLRANADFSSRDTSERRIHTAQYHLPKRPERLNNREDYREPLRAGGAARLMTPPDSAVAVAPTTSRGIDIPYVREDRYGDTMYQEPVRAGMGSNQMSPQVEAVRVLRISHSHSPISDHGFRGRIGCCVPLRAGGQISPPESERRIPRHPQTHVVSRYGINGRSEQQRREDIRNHEEEMVGLVLTEEVLPEQDTHLLPRALAIPASNIESVEGAAANVIKTEVGELSESENATLKHSLENKPHIINDGIGSDVEKMVEHMKQQTHDELTKVVTNVHKPYDPYLICPICGKMFRIGEIQKFRKHVVDDRDCSLVIIGD